MGTQVEKKFTWVIENFSELTAKLYSDQFVMGGCKWRVLAYPKGSRVNYLSLYLDVVESNSLPSGWRRHVEFRFRVVNQLSDQSSKSIGTRHWFNKHESDWGFSSVMPLAELRRKNSGYLLNDKLIIEVEVDVLEVIGKLDVSEKSEKAPEPPKHDALPTISKDGAGDISSLDQPEPLKEVAETVTNGITKCNNVTSSVKASNNSLKETQLENEIVDVNGFQVLSSQVNSVNQIFSRHPDIASNFRPKNQKLKIAYMNVLLNLIDTLCRPPQELSENILIDANNSLADLVDAGFRLDWLKPKLEEVSRKKRMIKQDSPSQLQGFEDELQKLMLMVSNLRSQLEKEKAEISAAKTPLSFDDVV